MPVVGGFKHALVSDGTGLNVENSTLRGCPLGVATEVKTCRVLPRCCPKDLAVNTQKNRAEIRNPKQKVAGAPEEIRTPDPQIRSLVLYPAELRALIALPETGPRQRGIAIGLIRHWQGLGKGHKGRRHSLMPPARPRPELRSRCECGRQAGLHSQRKRSAQIPAFREPAEPRRFPARRSDNSDA